LLSRVWMSSPRAACSIYWYILQTLTSSFCLWVFLFFEWRRGDYWRVFYSIPYPFCLCTSLFEVGLPCKKSASVCHSRCLLTKLLTHFFVVTVRIYSPFMLQWESLHCILSLLDPLSYPLETGKCRGERLKVDAVFQIETSGQHRINLRLYYYYYYYYPLLLSFIITPTGSKTVTYSKKHTE